jgi:hypothetical protein
MRKYRVKVEFDIRAKDTADAARRIEFLLDRFARSTAVVENSAYDFSPIWWQLPDA